MSYMHCSEKSNCALANKGARSCQDSSSHKGWVRILLRQRMCTLTDTGTMSRGGGGGVREGFAWELGFFFHQSAAEYILRTGQRGGQVN